ncbi:hypothetical protein P8C59_004025 [Phyllachora maydis]|uniref:Uncharacterized protein n=1 Tax=Phyllachora maydis TaxID=1825666 RepID=A0AAD9I1D8_9PEZI|nr:hypothetical protein P8C59_004025 [Phyllachora maydis]
MILRPLLLLLLLLVASPPHGGGVLARHHIFCWCESAQVPDLDACLTAHACAQYPQDRSKFFGVYGGDAAAAPVARMSPRRNKCYGTRAWPVIPHPFLGGDEFLVACHDAAAAMAAAGACDGVVRSDVQSRCSFGYKTYP